MPTFNETLDSEPYTLGAFDNYNKLNPLKNQNDGKGSINHIGTAYLLKKDKPYEIPQHTVMTPPNGVRFSVVSCDYHYDYKCELKGHVLDDSPVETNDEML